MDTKGGRFSMTINGKVYSGRGAAKIMSSAVSVKADVNSDGTGFKTVAPKLVGLDLNFDRGIGLKWDSAMMLANINVTFVETDAKITRMYTDAAWDGEPTTDSATGEVSGIKIMTSESNYQQF